MVSPVMLIPLAGIKLVEPGDDLGAITLEALAANGLVPKAGDVLVVAQKIVSKAEGRYVDVKTVEPYGTGGGTRRRNRQGPALCRDRARRVRSGWCAIAQAC